MPDYSAPLHLDSYPLHHLHPRHSHSLRCYYYLAILTIIAALAPNSYPAPADHAALQAYSVIERSLLVATFRLIGKRPAWQTNTAQMSDGQT